MKVNVFFSRQGKPLHCVRRDPGKDGIRYTLCGKACPSWFVLHPRHACKVDGLILECPACALELELMLKALEEQDNGIWQPTPAHTGPKPRPNGEGVMAHTPAAEGGQGTAGVVRTDGGGVRGPGVHPDTVDSGSGDPVAAGGGASVSGGVGAKPRPKREAKKRNQG